MDGKNFFIPTTFDTVSEEKEVNSMNEFQFDLQRFDGTTWTLTLEDNKLKFTNGSTSHTIEASSSEYTLDSSTNSWLKSGDTINIEVSSKVELGDNKILFGENLGTVNLTVSGEFTNTNRRFLQVASGTTLNISGTGKITNTVDDTGAAAVFVRQGGSCTIDGVNMSSSTGSAVITYASDITVKGGTLSGGLYAINHQTTGSASITGGTFTGDIRKGGSGTVSITGGKFDKNVSEYITSGTEYHFLDGNLTVGSAAPPSYTSGPLELDGVNKFYYSTTKTAADIAVAQIGDKYYTSLQKAADAVKDGETITLLKDTTTGFEINNGYAFTLNLNGHNITTNNWCAIVLGSSNKSDSGGAYAATKANKLTITGSGSITNNGGSGIGIYGPYKQSDATTNHSQLIIGSEGGTDAINITGSSFGVFGNGIAHYADITVNTAGTIKGNTASGIYNPQEGILTVNGGTIQGGESGIEIRSGELNVTGQFATNISSTATAYKYVANSDGTTTDGAGIAVAQHVTQKAITVNIGTGDVEKDSTNIRISGQVALSVANPQLNNASVPAPIVNVKGGYFDGTNANLVTKSTESADATTNESAAMVSDTRVTVNVLGGLYDGILNKGFLDGLRESASLSSVYGLGDDTTSVSLDGGGSYALSGSKVYFTTESFANLSKDLNGFSVKQAKLTYDKSGDGSIGDDEKDLAVWQYDVGAKVARIGTTEYESLDAAIAAAADGATITLLNDVTVTATQTINKNITLDLGEYTITSNVRNLFDVQKGTAAGATAPTFTITSSGGDGQIIFATNASASTNEGLVHVGGEGATFNMTGGKLSGKFSLVNVESGGKANITGATTIELTGVSTSGVYGIKYGEGAEVVIGSSSGTQPTITAVDSTVKGDTYLVYGVEDSAITSVSGLTINGGTINSTLTSNNSVIYGVYAENGTVSITGGNISAQDGAFYFEGTEATVSGGDFNAISENGYGLYVGSTSSLAVSGDKTAIDALAQIGSTAQNISFEYGFSYGGSVVGQNNYYTTETDGNDIKYVFNSATLTGSDGNYTYTFDGDSTDSVIGTQQTIGFAGNLIDANSLSAAFSEITISSTDDGHIVSLGSYDNYFALADGNSLQVATDGYTFSTDGFDSAGTYYSTATFATVGSGDASAYAYFGAGADTTGYIYDATSLTYRTERENAFTLDGGIKFAESDDISSLASFFSISGTEGNKTVTVTDTALFGTQDGNATLKIATNGYKLDLKDDLAVASISSASFSISNDKAVYQGTGVSTAGYTEDTVNGVITYHGTAAQSFAFANDGVYDGGTTDTLINFASNDTLSADLFTLSADGKEITIGSAAFSTLQANGAQLSLASGYEGYTLHFAEDFLAGTYSSVDAISGGFKPTSNNDGTYVYTTPGMTGESLGNGTLGGYTYTTITADSTDSVLTYHAASTAISIEATGVTLNTDNDNFSFEGKVLTIDTLSAFGDNLSDGDVVSLTTAGYTLKLADGITTLGSNDVNTEAKYDAATRTYSGIGASVNGFTAGDAGNSFTYHEQYATLSFAEVADSLALNDAVSVAGAISVTDNVININSAAFAEGMTSGQSISLSADSYAQGYRISLTGSDLDDAGVYNDKATFNAGKKAYTWTDAGSENNGYKVSDDGSALTYYTPGTEINFAINGIAFDTENFESVAAAISFKDSVVTIDKDAFAATQTNLNKLAFNEEYGYTMSLGANVSVASDGTSLASFTGSDTVYSYFGKGASSQGYALTDDNKSITYYDVAKQFTLSSDVALNTAEKSDSVDSYFTVDDSGVTMNAAAISDSVTLKTGNTISLTGSNFTDGGTFALNGLDAVEAGNVVKEATLSASNYMSDGVTTGSAGFLAGEKSFTYYGVADTLAIQTGESAVKFAAQSGDTLKDAFTFSADGTTVTINNDAVFDNTSLNNQATLAAQNGVKLVINGALADSAVYTVEGLTSTDNGYTYNGIGGKETLGFYQTADTLHTYYKEAQTFDFSGNISLKTGAEFAATSFAVDGTNVTIGKGAIANYESLTSGASLTFGEGYNVAIFTTGTDSLATTTLLPEAYTTTVDGGVYKGLYNAAGGKDTEGFVANSNNLTFYEKAEAFTLTGSDVFTSGMTDSNFFDNYMTVDKGTSGTIAVSLDGSGFDTSKLSTGSSLSIVNDDNDRIVYQLSRGNLTEAQGITNVASFADNTSGDTKTYTYTGAGATTTAGWKGTNDTLLTYYANAETFTLSGDIALLADSINSAMSSYVTVNEAGNAITISASAFDTANTENAAALTIAGGNGAYAIAITGGNVLTDTGNVQQYATVNGNTYTGKGVTGQNAAAGYYLSNNNSVLTYYAQADTFTIGSDIQFNTSLTSDERAAAMTIDKAKNVTVSNFNLFTSLDNGDTLGITDGYTLNFADDLNSTVWNTLEQSEVNTAQTLLALGDNSYGYKGIGTSDNIAGFYKDSTSGSITYYTPYDAFTISGGALVADATVNFGNYFTVSADDHKVTISATAFDTEKLTQNTDFTFTFADGTTPYTIDVAGKSDPQSMAATWGTGESSLTWYSAGYNENAFSVSGSVITYYAPTVAVAFATSDADSLNGHDFTYGPASLVSIEDGVVKLSQGFASTTVDGAVVQLATGSPYTLDATALTVSGNTYTSQESFANNTYTGAGMSSVDGYVIDGNSAVWHNKSDVLTFETQGITFKSDGNNVASNITVKGNDVTINGAAFSATTWDNNSYVSLATGNYTISTLTGVTGAGAISAATLNGKTYTSEGATSAGYTLEGGNKITYYDKADQVIFTGDINFNSSVPTAVANIFVNGTEVTVNKEAIDASTLKGDGSEKLGISGKKYSFAAIADADTLSTNRTESFVNWKYTGVGADKAGFTLNEENTLLYWKQYDQFTINSVEGAVFADDASVAANYFSVTSATGNNEQGTIKILADFATIGNGQSFVLGADYASLYNFDAGDLATIGAVMTGNQLDVSTGAFTVGGTGADVAGYTLLSGSTGSDTLTYYAEADKFTLGTKDGTNAIKFVANAAGNANPNDDLIMIENGVITFAKSAFDTANLIGGEQLQILGSDKYTLSADGLTKVQGIEAASFDNTTGVYHGLGARNTGYNLENNILTYYKESDSATLTASSGTFKDVKDSLSTYFTFGNSMLTINNVNFIDGITDGVTLGIDSAHTLAFGDEAAAKGDYTATDSFNTGGKTYTSAGMSGQAGFRNESNSYVYRQQSDIAIFEGDLAFNSDAYTGGYITLDKTTGKFTIADAAFTTLSKADNASLKIADSTSTLFSLDITFGDSLTSAGTYYTENTVVGNTFYGTGADNNGYAVDTLGASSLHGGTLIYHTKRENQFDFAGGISLAADNDSLASYLSIGAADANSVKTVLVTDTSLFGSAQTNGAQISIAGDTFNGYTYKLDLKDDLAVEVSDAQLAFTTDKITYTAAGSNSIGYAEDTVNGVLTYYDTAAATLAFANDGVYTGGEGDKFINFKTTTDGTIPAGWFTMVGNDITVHAAALSSIQAAGAQLSLASGSENYTLHFADDILTSGGTYSSTGTFQVNENGGGVYGSAGMSETVGYSEDSDGVLTYHDAATKVSLEGNILFNSLEGSAVDGAFSLDSSSKTLIIKADALASVSSQTNLATLSASGDYKLALDGGVATVTDGSIEASMAKNKTYTGAGASSAGYALTNNTLITYYGQRDSFRFVTDADFSDSLNAYLKDPTTSPIKISNDKVVTVEQKAFDTSSFVAEITQLKLNGTGYTLSLASDLSGGTYDSVRTFNAADKIYKFAGADKTGFVKVNADDDAYTYYLATDTIQFGGSMEFNSSINAAAMAEHISLGAPDDAGKISVSINSAEIFSPYNDSGTNLQITAPDKYTLVKNGLATAGDTVAAALTGSTGNYTYKTYGATTEGFVDDNAGTITYYAQSKDIALTGDLELNTNAAGLAAISFGWATVGDGEHAQVLTFGQDALTTTNTGTLAVQGDYKLALADGITEWASVEAALNGQVYTIEGYSIAGYQANDSVLSYYDQTSENITFTGLASTATKDNIKVDIATGNITLDAAAIQSDPTTNNTVAISGTGYKLADYKFVSDGLTAYTSLSSNQLVAEGNNKVFKTAGVDEAGYTLASDSKSISYLAENNEDITLSGLASGAAVGDFTYADKTLQVNANAIGTGTVSVAGGDYSLALGNDAFAPTILADNALATEGDYKVFKTAGVDAAGYTLASDSKSVQYVAENNEDISLSGLAATATKDDFVYDANSKTVSVKANALSTESVLSVVGDYSLALYSDVTTPIILDAATVAGEIYKTAGVDEAGYSLAADGKSISYVAEDNADITLSGLASGTTADHIGLNASVLAVDTVAVGTGSISVVNAGYSFELGSLTEAAVLANNTLVAEGDNKVFKTAGIDESGYSLGAESRSISYVAENNDDITLSGLAAGATAENISFDKTNSLLTLDTVAAGDGTVSITGGDYKFGLGNLTAYASVDATTLSADKTLYTTAGVSEAGYGLGSDSLSITYFDKTSKAIGFSGLADGAQASDIIYDANSTVLGLTANAISTVAGSAPVSITSGDFSFELGNLTAATVLDAATVSGEVYKTAGVDEAGYSLASDSKSISYVAEDNADITISGLASGTTADHISLNDTLLAVDTVAVGTSSISVVNEGYAFELGTSLTAAVVLANNTLVAEGDNKVFKTAGIDESGYELLNNDRTINYVAEDNADVTLRGLASVATADNIGFDKTSSLLTLDTVAAGEGTVSITGGDYKFGLGNLTSIVTSVATLSSDKSLYTTAGVSKEGYALGTDSLSISYQDKDVKEIGFSGLADGAAVSDIIYNANSTVLGLTANAISTVAGSNSVSITSGDFSFELGDLTAATVLGGATLTDGVYKTAGVDVAGYELGSNNKSISYLDKDNTNITFTGLGSGASTVNVVFDGDKTFTIGNGALDSTKTASVESGYTLALGSDVPTISATEAIGFTYKDSVATYTGEGKTAGYTLADNQISYSSAQDGDVLFTITGVKSIDGLSLNGTEVTVKESALNQETVTISGGYTLKLDSDVTKSETSTEATYDEKTSTYTAAGVSKAGYQISDDGKTITYEEPLAFTFTGLTDEAKASYFKLDEENKQLRVARYNINKDGTPVVLTDGPDGYTLTYGNSMAAPETSTEATYDEKTSTYTAAGVTKAGYQISDDGKSITYVEPLAFTFTGLTDEAKASYFKLDEENKQLRVARYNINKDGTPVVLTDGPDGYKLTYGNSMAAPETSTEATYDEKTSTYTAAGVSKAGYKISDDGKSITYVEPLAFTFTGLTDEAKASYFKLDEENKQLRVARYNINKDGTPVVLTDGPDGYTLTYGNSMAAPVSSAATYDADSQTYTSAGVSTAGYTISEDGKTMTYEAKDIMTFEFSGLTNEKTGANYFTVNKDAKTIAVYRGNVDKEKGTPVDLLNSPDGYKLTYGNSMAAPVTVGASYDADTQTYTSAGVSKAGYTISDDGKTMIYEAKDIMTFEFSGLTNEKTGANYFTVNKDAKTIAVYRGNVDKENGTPVDLLNSPDGYKLTYGNSMAAPVSSEATYDADSQTYTSAGVSKAGYTISDDGKTMTYVPADTMTFEFSGLTNEKTGANYFVVDEDAKTIAVYRGNVDKENGTPVVLEKAPTGYTLAYGNKMSTIAGGDDQWGTLSNGTVSYETDRVFAHYELNDDKTTLTYVAASSTEALKLTGVATTPAAVKKGVVTLTAANFDSNIAVASNTNNYKFYIASGTYTDMTLTGSTEADTIKNTGAELTINTGTGNDSIVSSGAKVTIDAGAGADTITGSTGADYLNGGNGNDSILGGKGADTLIGGAGVDYLDGGTGNDSLNGGTGNDSLWGGAGNDTLTGGAGNDTFIYQPNTGRDTITDYASGDILQILKADGTNGTYTKAAFASNTLTLTIDGGGSVILTNVKSGSSVNINGTSHKISGSGLN